MRKGFHLGKWGKFRQRYRAELRATLKEDIMDRLATRAEGENVTLVFAARDEEHNNAEALRDFIEHRMKKGKRKTM